MENERIEKVLAFLDSHNIAYSWYTHPEAPTIEIARQYWRADGSKHCKNLFFRNQGKLSFASPQRMEKYLGLTPGSVSPFGLINDTDNHVHLFLDENLQQQSSLSFHPNDNHATVVISQDEFTRYLATVGNTFEYIAMYDK